MEEELSKRSAHDDSGLMYNIDEADPDFTSDFGQVRNSEFCFQF